jgi:hypothetical protein
MSGVLGRIKGYLPAKYLSMCRLGGNLSILLGEILSERRPSHPTNRFLRNMSLSPLKRNPISRQQQPRISSSSSTRSNTNMKPRQRRKTIKIRYHQPSPTGMHLQSVETTTLRTREVQNLYSRSFRFGRNERLRNL